VAWTGSAKLVAQAVSWAATLILGRLLQPSDYGLVAMAGAITGVIQILSELGISQTVVTLRELSDDAVEQLNGLAVAIGFAACAFAMAVARPVAWFFDSERLVAVTATLSLGFVITSLKIVPAALLRRELAFRRLAVVDASGSAVLSLTMILLALAGFGVWTLVFGTLASQAFSTFVILRTRPVAFRVPRRKDLRGALTFTRHQLTGNLLWHTYTSADFLVAGKTLGERVAGIYYFAWALSKTIPEKVTGLIVNVAPSYFSAVQEDLPELRRYFLRLTEAIALVTFPALVGLALLASEVESHVLGPRWTGLSAPLRILALYAAVTSVTPLLSRVLTARRQTRFLVRTGAVMTASLVTGFWIGSHWGAAGIAAAWLVIEPPFQFVILHRACRAIDLPITEYLRALAPALSMSAVMAVAVAASMPWLRGHLAPLLSVAALAAIGCAVYVGAGFLLHRSRMTALASALRLG
jgi:O-antigen/teichoic acid export membrane protein